MAMRGASLDTKFSAKVTATQATADTSVSFLENTFNVQGESVRDIFIGLDEQTTPDATSILTNITRVSLFYGGQKGWDMPTAHFRALFGWMSKKAEWVTGQKYVQLPLHMFRGYSAPPGQQMSLVLTKNATFATNQVPKVSMHLGYNKRDTSKGYTYAISQKYNIPVSNPGFGINPSQPGVLQYVILPSLTGITGMTYYDAEGQRVRYTDVHALTVGQELYSGAAYAAPYSGPFVFKVPVERPLKAGVTQVEFVTDANWVDDEIGLVTCFPNPNADPKK